MDNSLLEKEVVDLLYRVEGTIKVNEQGNPLLVDRKLQGVKDKLTSLLSKTRKKNLDEVVLNSIEEAK